jgi:lipopolysaccharide exporter
VKMNGEISSDTKRPSIAVVLPAEERLDGTGGAIATWTLGVFVDESSRVTIFSPAAGDANPDRYAVALSRLYNLFDSAAHGFARGLAKQFRKNESRVYSRLLLGGVPWIALQRRAISRHDIVYIHNRPGYAFHLRQMGFRGRIVLHMHNDLANYLSPRHSQDRLDKIDLYIFCSEYLRTKAEHDYGPLPAVVVHNGVDVLPRHRESRPPRSMAFVGRLIAEKGVDIAIEICDLLNQSGLRWTLDIYGASGSGSVDEPSEFKALLDSMAAAVNRTYGAGTVTLHGPVSHSKVLASLRSTRYLLHPCRWEEPFGMVLVEAMAVGTVPIASAAGGIPEILRNESCGILIADYENAVSFVPALRDLESSPAQRSSLQQCGYAEVASRFTWDAVREQVFDVLE